MLSKINDSTLQNAIIKVFSTYQSSGYQCYLVGGAVRDMLCGQSPKDFDFATNAPYEFTNNNFEKTIDTGIAHGTITVVIDHHTFEITRFRTEKNHDGRHCDIEFAETIEEDLSRRDFTINSMAMTSMGEIIDPFGGKEDLQNGVVRFVGLAEKRIREDYLRILRWFRFRGRFERDGNVDLQARVWVKRFASGLANISRERIWSEIAKIVSGTNGPDHMWEIHELGCATHCNLNTWGINTYFTKLLHEKTKNPITLMVSLYDGYSKNETSRILSKWNASSAEIKMAEFLSTSWTDKKSVFELLAVDNPSREWVIETAYLRDMDDFDITVLQHWEVPVFPVTGYDLIALGMEPGPKYGEVMTILKNVWAKHGFDMSKEKLLSFVKV